MWCTCHCQRREFTERATASTIATDKVVPAQHLIKLLRSVFNPSAKNSCAPTFALTHSVSPVLVRVENAIRILICTFGLHFMCQSFLFSLGIGISGIGLSKNSAKGLHPSVNLFINSHESMLNVPRMSPICTVSANYFVALPLLPNKFFQNSVFVLLKWRLQGLF